MKIIKKDDFFINYSRLFLRGKLYRQTLSGRRVKQYLGEFGEKQTHLFTAAQVAAIFKAIGEPIVNDNLKGTGLRKYEMIAIVTHEIPLEERLKITGSSSEDVQ